MSWITLTGALLITLALLSYGIGTISIQRFKIITSGVLIFITLGMLLDLIAVTFMVLGTEGTPFTPHGFIGFSATLTMFVNFILVGRIFLKNGMHSKIQKSIVTYSKYAFGWWVLTYITGSLMVLW